MPAGETPTPQTPTPQTPTPDAQPVVIRISPMAQFAPAFLAVSILVLIPAFGNWALALLLIPALVSIAIVRLRTVADRDAVTARSLLSTKTVPWSQIEGLRFTRGGWARACGAGGDALLLPAVTFATLPRLTAASAGRVPNPYRSTIWSGERVNAVQEEPGRYAAAGAEQQREE
jgi:membrane protease YdiL (CAAX protease family)